MISVLVKPSNKSHLHCSEVQLLCVYVCVSVCLSVCVCVCVVYVVWLSCCSALPQYMFRRQAVDGLLLWCSLSRMSELCSLECPPAC